MACWWRRAGCPPGAARGAMGTTGQRHGGAAGTASRHPTSTHGQSLLCTGSACPGGFFSPTGEGAPPVPSPTCAQVAAPCRGAPPCSGPAGGSYRAPHPKVFAGGAVQPILAFFFFQNRDHVFAAPKAVPAVAVCMAAGCGSGAVGPRVAQRRCAAMPVPHRGKTHPQPLLRGTRTPLRPITTTHTAAPGALCLPQSPASRSLRMRTSIPAPPQGVSALSGCRHLSSSAPRRGSRRAAPSPKLPGAQRFLLGCRRFGHAPPTALGPEGVNGAERASDSSSEPSQVPV